MKEKVCIVVDSPQNNLGDNNSDLASLLFKIFKVWGLLDLDESNEYELTGILLATDLTAWTSDEIRATKNCILIRHPQNNGLISPESNSFIKTAQRMGKRFYVIGNVNPEIDLFPKNEADEVESNNTGLRRVFIK